MIRTRDFLLFVVALVFLLVAIAGTIVRDGKGERTKMVDLSVSGDGYVSSAVTEEVGDIDRQSIISRLREKIRTSDLVITDDPSVTQEEVEESEEAGDTESAVSALTLQRCLYPDDALSIVPKWPLTGVSVVQKEGALLVYTQEDVVVPDTTSTTSAALQETTQSVVTPLLQLPLHPKKLSQAACVPSEVIGVTKQGVLMFNGDMRSYRGVSANVQIGYARDGFPIYGVYDGEVDACGGYDHPAGYRYTVSGEYDFVIGCFVGSVSKFNL